MKYPSVDVRIWEADVRRIVDRRLAVTVRTREHIRVTSPSEGAFRLAVVPSPVQSSRPRRDRHNPGTRLYLPTSRRQPRAAVDTITPVFSPPSFSLSSFASPFSTLALVSRHLFTARVGCVGDARLYAKMKAELLLRHSLSGFVGGDDRRWAEFGGTQPFWRQERSTTKAAVGFGGGGDWHRGDGVRRVWWRHWRLRSSSCHEECPQRDLSSVRTMDAYVNTTVSTVLGYPSFYPSILSSISPSSVLQSVFFLVRSTNKTCNMKLYRVVYNVHINTLTWIYLIWHYETVDQCKVHDII